MRFLIILLALASSLHAARQIEVTATFADIPAGAEVPATIDRLSKVKNANLLNSPRILVVENAPGKIEIVQETDVPGAKKVGLGVTLDVKASITEKGNIWFSGQITDRSRGGGQKTERLETAGFATREWYFSGWTLNEGTVLIRTAPVTSQVVREGKTIESSRELVVYLQFKKVGASASASKKSSTTSKPAAKKPTPTKSSARRRR
jgi:hypothetical protein